MNLAVGLLCDVIMEFFMRQLEPRIACYVETLQKNGGKLGLTGSSAHIVDVNTG